MSGDVKKFYGTLTGVAGDVTINKVPFRPRVIRFYVTGGRWGVKIEDEVGMDGSNYLSNTAADAGVTITDTGFVLANGADVNVAGAAVYYECED